MKVLVIQIKMIGDVLASTVICETIKIQNPNWEVHYLIQPNTLAVVENNPYIDKIILFDPKKDKGFFNLLKLGKELKKEQYHIIIDAYGKWESILPAFFSNTKIRIGGYKWYTQLFYTKTIKLISSKNGTANEYRLLLTETALHKKIDLAFPKIHLTNEELEKAKKAISENCDISKPIFMISVLGSSKKKSLPSKHMAKTLDILATSKEDIQLLFNYIPSQFNEVKDIYDSCLPTTQEKINLDFYAKSLRDFIGLLSQCDALIGNEGGATNMAKALNIPTFTIYAPWINRNSWNIKEETGFHDIIHLSDYHPELYLGKHPKKFKDKALEWYELLNPSLFKEKLELFIKRITT